MAPPTHIPQTDPLASYLERRQDIDTAVQGVLSGGAYILGAETAAFEAEFADFVGCSHGVGVGNGTDAIVLALRGLGVGPGSTVVTVSHTAVATVAAIEAAGATPLLVDINRDTFTMCEHALADVLKGPPPATGPIRAVVLVHLYGQSGNLSAIVDLVREHGAHLIEDCAQSHGATYEGRPLGSFGDAACFSFYPTKNLGAFGDGGLLATSNAALAAEVRALREYGWRKERYISASVGVNTRLDELQAAILRVKLKSLAQDNARRSAIADYYDERLAGAAVKAPVRAAGVSHVFHQYVVRTPGRDELRAWMQSGGVGVNVHYPVPVHLQPAYKNRVLLGSSSLAETERAATEVMSLPMFPQLPKAAAEQAMDRLLAWAP